ncbi:hypothetical protein VIGAN_01045200 [Vigna angularis var. angularis]|uniref:Uncharacterized protein n=1 Tax=Vigna angularis var. angularis TaxID=157739 RepID=A0A0S3QXD8_PHAAN|nr:hypothetical protein VIGAN_01045200 [Vigna angularis var. angularis]
MSLAAWLNFLCLPEVSLVQGFFGQFPLSEFAFHSYSWNFRGLFLLTELPSQISGAGGTSLLAAMHSPHV